MTLITKEDKQQILSTTTKKERATVEEIMALLNGYSFQQAKKILSISDTILATALVDSTKCVQFFEESGLTE
ncbi:MAG: hypothetical protein J6N55_06570 [Anaerovibrio sp.]|uniref:hypothetical protein n=1 Tax=Anaerovibrio sp. TaxID=1872532 RepID=UPI001B1CAE0E|nr:hypothetical protein [Anaerovibrio sp.]MBO5588520.1 hypothetical protein [Anaerovibrio sp.]MBO6245927.1 hypothetical protein [Anaerovibrio sp.]